MIAIHGEFQRIEKGEWDKTNNPLKNAPHPADVIAGDDWNRPYTRAQAAFLDSLGPKLIRDDALKIKRVLT